MVKVLMPKGSSALYIYSSNHIPQPKSPVIEQKNALFATCNKSCRNVGNPTGRGSGNESDAAEVGISNMELQGLTRSAESRCATKSKLSDAFIQSGFSVRNVGTVRIFSEFYMYVMRV